MSCPSTHRERDAKAMRRPAARAAKAGRHAKGTRRRRKAVRAASRSGRGGGIRKEPDAIGPRPARRSNRPDQAYFLLGTLWFVGSQNRCYVNFTTLHFAGLRGLASGASRPGWRRRARPPESPNLRPRAQTLAALADRLVRTGSASFSLRNPSAPWGTPGCAPIKLRPSAEREPSLCRARTSKAHVRQVAAAPPKASGPDDFPCRMGFLKPTRRWPHLSKQKNMNANPQANAARIAL